MLYDPLIISAEYSQRGNPEAPEPIPADEESFERQVRKAIDDASAIDSIVQGGHEVIKYLIDEHIDGLQTIIRVAIANPRFKKYVTEEFRICYHKAIVYNKAFGTKREY